MIDAASDLLLSVGIGLIPSCAMAIVSLVFLSANSWEASTVFQAACQSLCGGLILAAVAVDLFPIVNASIGTGYDAMVGMCAVGSGFAVSLGFLYGTGFLVDKYVELCEASEGFDQSESGSEKTALNGGSFTLPVYTALSSSDVGGSRVSSVSALDEDWDDVPVALSARAIAEPFHRAKLISSAAEINDCLAVLGSKVREVISHSHDFKYSDEANEEIDLNIHILQYKIDRCRRLLEGSGAVCQVQHGPSAAADEHRKLFLKHIGKLKAFGKHVREHFDSNDFDEETVKEIHSHLTSMDLILSRFHEKVSIATSNWKKRRAIDQTPIPEKGSLIPATLMVPVLIDAMIDGSLIGLATAISVRIGFILALTNAVEMSFLGIAVALRIRKCTGSHVVLRYLSVLAPAVAMLLFTVAGMFFGASIQSNRLLYLAAVSFGIVALVCLACNELLFDSKTSMSGEDCWWNTAMVFVGFFLILAMDKIV